MSRTLEQPPPFDVWPELRNIPLAAQYLNETLDKSYRTSEKGIFERVADDHKLLKTETDPVIREHAENRMAIRRTLRKRFKALGHSPTLADLEPINTRVEFGENAWYYQSVVADLVSEALSFWIDNPKNHTIVENIKNTLQKDSISDYLWNMIMSRLNFVDIIE